MAFAKLDALLALCEATTCRRVRLLDYFGETMIAVACGNCDICHHRRESGTEQSPHKKHYPAFIVLASASIQNI
ncbi:RecQ family zinc-binding domain-containing protein [Nitrosomonas sp. Is37]|uniref:RecQ family zinc-binding domain-containing protein n=1 Tax=Nitrosomonas sp. Is37 TaxID=3080535 RepID=UPI00294B7356|nr:RecQ family zinc-binding domain-containing protein [Nitrosomonas sp. Is37]MDV6345662.1 RecQ family zinc-binding domain-containing protein [Nitrosomonas sp. Is37]